MLIQPAQLEYLERLSASIESHRPTVYLITFVICAVFSYAMLTSYRSARSEKWIKYIGVASAILAAQYLVRVVCWYLGEHGATDPVRYDSSPVVQSLLQILSAANNIWFLATARELKNRKPAFPNWAWGLFLGAILVTAAGDFFMMPDHWLSIFLARSVDKVFSALCLVLLGHAIYTNISFRVSWWTASAAIFFAVLYALVHILSWLSPMLAHFFLSTPGVLEEKMIRQLLDSLLMAISLPLKLSIFLPAYGLLLRFVETLNDLAKLQDKVIDARQDYLSSDGVVQLISEKLGGEVDLIILLPGDRNRRLASIPWPNKDPEKRVQVLSWTVCDPSICESLLGSKEVQSRSDSGPFVVIEPIEAHGSAIGCLKVSRSDYPFSQMAVRQIKAIANLVSPAVQSYRELAALDLLSIRFAEEQSEEHSVTPSDAAKLIAEILHDAFLPVVTRFHLNFGFVSLEPIYLGDSGVARSMTEHIDWTEWNQIPLDFCYQGSTYFKLLKKRLTAKSKDTTELTARLEDDKPSIGRVVLALTKTGDDRGHPALGTNYLHRKTAATLAADAYLDFARDYFGDLLKRLGTSLSRRTMSEEEWFEPVGEAAMRAGFAWVLAVGGLKKALDECDYLTTSFLEESTEENEAAIIYQGEEGIIIKWHSLSDSLAGANHVIKINLSGSAKTIWLGVERPGFEGELSFASPWKSFLLDFAKIADAALTRVTYAIELQRKQIEAAHYQGLASAVVTTGTIIHQLSNLAHGHSSSISTLLDALAVGELTTNVEIERLMNSMKRSSEQMKKFLSAITNVTKTDERRPSSLLEAAKQAGVLFEASLLQRKIDLRISVDEDLMLDVPFSVATLAIANLIGNAKDAMPRGGRIRVDAESNGNIVLCRVVDQGRGVPQGVRDSIFGIGVSTKNGAGSGWGLYLTKRSLQENRSKIELTETNDKGSTFTIYFPKSK